MKVVLLVSCCLIVCFTAVVDEIMEEKRQ